MKRWGEGSVSGWDLGMNKLEKMELRSVTLNCDVTAPVSLVSWNSYGSRLNHFIISLLFALESYSNSTYSIPPAIKASNVAPDRLHNQINYIITELKRRKSFFCQSSSVSQIFLPLRADPRHHSL